MGFYPIKRGKNFYRSYIDEADSFSKGFAEVKMDTLWGVIEQNSVHGVKKQRLHLTSLLF